MEKIPMDDMNIKAPQDAILDLPQEAITGDVLRGYGPRRGNLERLLRYWRPIMKKPGGFRRCKVILANHPELYPLNNICAWLHHETTGLWPNEGCHHPGMKNCRRKIKKIANGSIWTEKDWNRRMSQRFGKKKSLNDDVFFDETWYTKGLDQYGDSENLVVTTDDLKHAILVLRDFCEMEPLFVSFLRDNNNWEMYGDDHFGNSMKSVVPLDKDCGCDE
jgi:hypothetical protein